MTIPIFVAWAFVVVERDVVVLPIVVGRKKVCGGVIAGLAGRNRNDFGRIHNLLDILPVIVRHVAVVPSRHVELQNCRIAETQ
jgi:hypothetical protein